MRNSIVVLLVVSCFLVARGLSSRAKSASRDGEPRVLSAVEKSIDGVESVSVNPGVSRDVANEVKNEVKRAPDQLDTAELYSEIARLGKTLEAKYFDTHFQKIEEPYPLQSTGSEWTQRYQEWVNIGRCWKFSATIPGQHENFRLSGNFQVSPRFTERFLEADSKKEVSRIYFSAEFKGDDSGMSLWMSDVYRGPDAEQLYFFQNLSTTKLKIADEFPLVVFTAPSNLSSPIEIRVFSLASHTWQIIESDPVRAPARDDLREPHVMVSCDDREDE
jgi:hypothetical protein